MIIQYYDNNIRRKCQKAQKGSKLKQRLDEIAAAGNMEVVEVLPGRHHALSSSLAGRWACHLEEPYRLIYQPIGDPLPVSIDGHLDLSKVEAVCIVGVVNYHEHKNCK